MRIAVWHNLPSGGGKRALFDHVRGLIALGHHVEVWCPASADTAFLPLSSLCQEHVLPWPYVQPKPRTLQSSRQYALELHEKMRASEQHSREAAAIIDAADFDVLFANTCQFTGAPSIAKYSTLPTCLYLQEPHRILYEAFPDPLFAALSIETRSSFAPWYVKRVMTDYFRTKARRSQIATEHANAKACATVLVNSYFSRESVLRAYGIDSHVCYLGIDHSRYHSSVGTSKANAVVGIGAIGIHKNIEFVIRAVGQVNTPRPQLIWIGNSSHSDELQRLNRIAAECNVDFKPSIRVSDEEMVSLMSRAFAMAYAPRLEPFGYAPLEANALGLPVIAVAEGGVRETVCNGVNGLVVDADPSAMAAGIQTLRDDPQLASKLGETGRAIVLDKWSLEAATSRLEKYLLQTIQNYKMKRTHHA